MQKRFKYRIYPHPQQRQALARAFGCARVVWNDALALQQEAWQERQERLSANDLMKLCITQAKQTPERAWLKQVHVTPLQQSLRDLDRAFKNWWKGLKGKGRTGAPRFKRRHNRQAIRFNRNGFYCGDHAVRIGKVGEIPIIWSRPLPAVPSSATGRQRLCWTLLRQLCGPGGAPLFSQSCQRCYRHGSGLGIPRHHFGWRKDLPAEGPTLCAEGRLRRLQRNLKHQQRGANRLARARLLVAKLHAKVADRRMDFLHQLSTRIIRENQTVVLEDLNVSGMVKNRKLSRSIADAGWRMFRTLLESKAAEHGRDLVVINRWTPTSQTCSACGYRDGKKALSLRQWPCPNCGVLHDRDINAAQNILAAGLAERLNGRAEPGIRPLRWRQAVKRQPT